MPNNPNPSRTVPVVAAILAIAATYGFFLLFGEFALLELAKPLFGGERALRPLLAVLGAGGVAGSLLAAWRFDLRRFRGALAGGFAACAVSAAVSLSGGRPGLWFAAGATGLSLGWTTVTLSAGLRAVAGARRLGLWCGLGTGLAYAVGNLPAVFEATPQAQAAIALGFTFVGILAAGRMQPEVVGAVEASDGERRDWLVWGAIFLALVWLDSAGFYILQHTPELRAQTWSGPLILYGNALTHLLSAVVAGCALDARRLGGTAFVALVFLGVADLLLGQGAGGFAGTRMLYTIGVSAYSVALVHYPAFGARPWVVAGIFSVAGWLGSALGIGMVQDLHAIPEWFIALAGVVVFGALAVRSRQLRRSEAVLTVGVAALCLGPRMVSAEDATVALGREVYIAEGCINCHSQYVRPGVLQEVLWWGPARPLAANLAETPPLIGLRRQGPDLMNVGNRRSPDWQRLHLIAPRTVSPGSRMPGYAHLFRAGDRRGEALVAYLGELGAETMAVRRQQIAGWKPAAEAMLAPFNGPAARQQFVRLCASCHGPEFRGDGMLAGQLALKPPDFTREAWRQVRADEPDRVLALTRIIKFGVPGTPMAGREYLDDATAVMLARHVEALSRGQRAR